MATDDSFDQSAFASKCQMQFLLVYRSRCRMDGKECDRRIFSKPPNLIRWNCFPRSRPSRTSTRRSDVCGANPRQISHRLKVAGRESSQFSLGENGRFTLRLHATPGKVDPTSPKRTCFLDFDNYHAAMAIACRLTKICPWTSRLSDSVSQ